MPHLSPNYAVWQIAYDTSARIDARKTMQYFPDRITNENRTQWTHDGIELVPRVLTVPNINERGHRDNSSMAEAERYLKALHSRPHDPWACTADSENIGLHIHIGTQNDQGVPLKVLQHLAYMLVRYEEIILSFHIPARRASSTGTATSWAYVSLAIAAASVACQSCLPELTVIQGEIFDEHVTATKLAQLMDSTGKESAPSTRYKLVNFENTKDRKFLDYTPNTIEFRQHHRSLDAREIGEWVYFLTALMRAAERRAREVTPSPSSTKVAQVPRDQWTRPMRKDFNYQFVCKNQRDKTNEFHDLLELPRRAKEYWLKRYARYNHDVFTDAPLGNYCDECKCAEEEKAVAEAVAGAGGGFFRSSTTIMF